MAEGVDSSLGREGRFVRVRKCEVRHPVSVVMHEVEWSIVGSRAVGERDVRRIAVDERIAEEAAGHREVVIERSKRKVVRDVVGQEVEPIAELIEAVDPQVRPAEVLCLGSSVRHELVRVPARFMKGRLRVFSNQLLLSVSAAPLESPV